MVPCGDGKITVRELANQASLRYKKNLKDSGSFRVLVSSLKWEGNGGVLDPDDLVSEVCDEREHLIAVFDYEAIAGRDHGGRQYDKMAFSSVGAENKETFQV